MPHTTSRLRYVLVALLLLVAACGGGEGGEDFSDGDGDNGGTGFGTPSTVGNVAGLSSECESLTNLSIAMTSMFGGSPEEVDRLLEGVRDVPRDLEDEVDLLKTAIRSLAQAWAEVGANPLSDPSALAEMSDADRERIESVIDQFSDDASDEAFERIGEYVADECIRFGPTG